VDSAVQSLLGLAVIVFMAGNLLEVGLKLNLDSVSKTARDVRFLSLSVLIAFILCPAFAFLLTRIIPLSEPYAIGLIFLGMAPGAPFFPVMAERAGGDLDYIAMFLLLTIVGTVLFMPLATPYLAEGFRADAWTIAKPLVFYIIVPMVVGVLVRYLLPALAEKSRPFVRMATVVDTFILLLLVLWLYGADFVRAIGEYAIASQLLLYALITISSYGLALGLRSSERSVIVLGSCTRNIGAAFAPLLSVLETDRRSIAMVALAVPLTIFWAALVVWLLNRLSRSEKTGAGGDSVSKAAL
jgi:BASS family bile acid:Na+ symporter